MVKTLLIVVVLVAIVFILLAVQILFKKNGTFPSTHIEDNEHLKKFGITCASRDEYEQCKTKNSLTGCEACNLTCSLK
jgi:hypothetical protein